MGLDKTPKTCYYLLVPNVHSVTVPTFLRTNGVHPRDDGPAKIVSHTTPLFGKEHARIQMHRILNLTQHAATPAQVEAGVIEPEDKRAVQELLTFVGIPTWDEVFERARELAHLCDEANVTYAMIGGAPYLMGPLHTNLVSIGIIPLYSFTERRSVETVQPDGTVTKTAVFEHVGFVNWME